MTQGKRLVWAGGAVFLLGVFAMLPARVIHHWFSPAELKLAGIEGTIWHGRAAEADLAGVYLRELRWTFRPLSLLRGRLAYRIAATPAGGFIEADAALGFLGAMHVDDLRASVPVSAVAGPLRIADVAGELNLQLASLRIENGWPQFAEGRAAVANLVLRALAPGPLGDFTADIQTTDGAILGSVEDVRGMLELAATFSLGPDRSYSLIGRVGPTATAANSVRQQLGFLGTPDARGLREFRIEGVL